MTFNRTMILGGFALVATTGCTTAMSPAAMDTSGGDFSAQASPAPAMGDARSCASGGGWYDAVAGACDDNAP